MRGVTNAARGDMNRSESFLDQKTRSSLRCNCNDQPRLIHDLCLASFRLVLEAETAKDDYPVGNLSEQHLGRKIYSAGLSQSMAIIDLYDCTRSHGMDAGNTEAIIITLLGKDLKLSYAHGYISSSVCGLLINFRSDCHA